MVQITCSLLKFRNKFGQVAGFACAFREKVNVIGHYAIGVYGIRVAQRVNHLTTQSPADIFVKAG